MNGTILLLILIIACVIAFVLWRKTKRLKIDNVYFISGGVKTGKTFLSVALAIKTYKKNVRKWRVRCLICKCLYFITKKGRFKDDSIKPMLYSNIPLRFVKHNRLTIDIIKRKVRIPNKSVVLIDETSLLADSQLFKDKEINDELMVFFKLFAHYTHGGTLIANSQAIGDNHYALKRCMNHYLYVNNRVKFPFVSIFSVREMLYSDDNSALNFTDKDVEKTLVKVWFLNRYYKYYDCYCYSIFTDSLSYYVDYDSRILKLSDSLKTDNLVTLQDFKTLDRRNLIKENNNA